MVICLASLPRTSSLVRMAPFLDAISRCDMQGFLEMSLNTWISVEFIHVHRGFCVNWIIGFTTERELYQKKNLPVKGFVRTILPFNSFLVAFRFFRNYSGLSHAKPQRTQRKVSGGFGGNYYHSKLCTTIMPFSSAFFRNPFVA